MTPMTNAPRERSARRAYSLCVSATVLLSLASLAHAAGWRNDGVGKFPQADPPASWSAQEGIVWKTPLPKGWWSNATPVISGDRIFLTAETTQTLVCVAKADGKILWAKPNSRIDIMTSEEIEEAKQNGEKDRPLEEKRKEVEKQRNDLRKAQKDNPQDEDVRAKIHDLDAQASDLDKQIEPLRKYAPPVTNGDNGYASATPVTDGKMVFTLFGTGIVVGYGVEGNRKWMRFIETPRDNSNWGFCTSPLLVDGKLLIHINDMMALDPATGKDIWTAKTPRAWGTSAITKIGDTKVAVTPGGDIIRIADGKILASRLFTMDFGSPIVENAIVYEADQGKGAATARAFKLPTEIPADGAAPLTAEMLWSTPVKNDRYYASPVLYEGILYIASGNGQNVLSAIDAADGKVIWEQQSGLKSHIYSSFSLAGKNLYISGEDDGAMLIVEPGRAYKELARIPLEKTRATAVFEGTRMYIRGMENLYCIGK
jgi:outer membrane protein assembly factor BamB